jgi:hypothetical protein
MNAQSSRWTIAVLALVQVFALNGTGFAAANHDLRYLQTRPPTQTESESPINSFVDLMDGAGPIFNAANPAVKGGKIGVGRLSFESKEALLTHLHSLSIKKRVQLLRLGYNHEAARSVSKDLSKNVRQFGERLDRLDKLGNLSEAAGAIAGGDAVGAGQAVVDHALSGQAALAGGVAGSTAGTWLGGKAGFVIGSVGGPVGAAVGGGIGTVGGALFGSYIYEWLGKPAVDQAGDAVVAHLRDKEEETEKRIRRIRSDLLLVYPQGVISDPGKPMPDPAELHRQAQVIRRQRLNERIERTLGIDDCPLDPQKTKPGICGCGVPDTDSDGDGVPDCFDECPQNIKRYQRGPFGCSDQAQVPHVVGLPAREAFARVIAADLAPAAGGGDPAPDKDTEHTIQSQTPAGGAPARAGAPVHMIIYSAYQPKEISVPNVIGLAGDDARAAVAGEGLVPSVVQGDPAPDPQKQGQVQRQTPPPGNKVPPRTSVVLTLYSEHQRSSDSVRDECAEKLQAYQAAFQSENMALCRAILAQSQTCAFHAESLARLNKWECSANSLKFIAATQNEDYGQAHTILATLAHCEEHERYGQMLVKSEERVQCKSYLDAMNAALGANDIARYRAILAQSQHCSYHASLWASLQDAERQAAEQRVRNDHLAGQLGQIVGGVLREWAASSPGGGGSGGSGGGSGGGGPAGPPVVMHSTCNDVRKAGANQPERHVIDLGTGGRAFLFEYETYTEKDQVIVTQRGNVLFNSGCVGTKGRRSVQLSKSGFGSEVTVDVRPNCGGGSNTQWEFIVHCPK